jgi:ubiquinone/menaquinone biosynthesis C-methylase UbiE
VLEAGPTSLTYLTTVNDVIALEPERSLRERALRAVAEAPVDGDAGCVPDQAQSFDPGVVALVLCTVPDQQQALAELCRVIHPR